MKLSASRDIRHALEHVLGRLAFYAFLAGVAAVAYLMFTTAAATEAFLGSLAIRLHEIMSK